MKHKIMSFVSVAAVLMMAVLFFNQKQILDEKDLKKYKESQAAEWSKILGGMDFDIFEEESTEAPTSIFAQEPE